MKKVFAALLSAAVLVSSAAVFCGCGEAKVYIEGDFGKEATAAEADALKTQVRGFSEKYAGDESASDWKYGLRMISEGKNNMKMTMSVAGRSVTVEADADSDIDLNFSVSNEDGSATYAYGGKFNYDMFMTGAGGENSGQFSAKMKGDIYGDAAVLYFDGSVNASLGAEPVQADGKYKFALDAPIGEAVDDAVSEILSGVSFDFDSPAASIEAYIDRVFGFEGVKMYIDESDASETKVKICLSGEAYIDSVLGGYGAVTDDADAVAQIVSAMDLKAADFYLSFNKTNGIITGLGSVFDIRLKDFTVSAGGESGFSMSISMDVSASNWMLLSDKSVAAPEDADEYTEYAA